MSAGSTSRLRRGRWAISPEKAASVRGSRRLQHECGRSRKAFRRRFVRYRPAEINLDLDNLAVPHRHYLGIAEGFSGGTLPFVSHEHALPIGDQIDEGEAGNRVAVFPASVEIRVTIDAIVARAGEMKIIPDNHFDHGAILVDIGLISSAGDSDRVVLHFAFLV